MNSNSREIINVNQDNKLFFETNQQTFIELLTFVDFVDNKLNIGLVEINFAQDRDILIEALIKHQNCQDIQFAVLNFPAPNLRFLRDELVTALNQIKIEPNKKLILLITGLENSIGVTEEYPDVLVNLNFVRDDLRISVPHPILLFLPDYALTRFAKYAPDFWAWGRKVFYFKTTRLTVVEAIRTINNNYKINADSLKLAGKQERIDLLLCLLSEYDYPKKKENKQNLLTLIDIYIQLGIAYYSLGYYQKAKDYYRHSLQIAQEIGNRRGIANALNNLGNIYKSLGEYQQAINYHQQSLQIKQEIGDRHGIARSLGNLGNAYYYLEEYQQAINYHQQSLQIKQEISDRSGISDSLGNLGNAYLSLGKYQTAIDYYQQSLPIKQEIGDRSGIANCLGNLGSVSYFLGEYQKAIDYYQQSLQIKQEIGDRHLEANTWFNLGDTWKNLQQKSKAKTAFENARKIYQAMELDEDVEKCDRAIESLEE